jgi:hypothetical protein
MSRKVENWTPDPKVGGSNPLRHGIHFPYVNEHFTGIVGEAKAPPVDFPPHQCYPFIRQIKGAKGQEMPNAGFSISARGPS